MRIFFENTKDASDFGRTATKKDCAFLKRAIRTMNENYWELKELKDDTLVLRSLLVQRIQLCREALQSAREAEI